MNGSLEERLLMICSWVVVVVVMMMAEETQVLYSASALLVE